MRLFIAIFRRIFNGKRPLENNKRKEIIKQLKRLKQRDKQEQDAI